MYTCMCIPTWMRKSPKYNDQLKNLLKSNDCKDII